MRSPSRQFAQPSIHGRESLRGRPRSRPRVPPCGLRHTPARMCQRARKPSHKRSTRGRNQPFAAAAPNEPWGGSAIHSATEDVRPCNLKNTPNLSLGAPPVLAQVRQSQKNCALRQVRSCDDAFDAVENDRSGSLKEHFFAIRIKLADREAPPACETAQRSESQAGRSDKLSKARRWLLLAAMKRSRSSRGAVLTGAGLGSTSALRIFDSTVLAGPCSPDTATSG
jgi:hypothetical protein